PTGGHCVNGVDGLDAPAGSATSAIPVPSTATAASERNAPRARRLRSRPRTHDMIPPKQPGGPPERPRPAPTLIRSARLAPAISARVICTPFHPIGVPEQRISAPVSLQLLRPAWDSSD